MFNNLKAMDSTSEIGAQIIEAGASGDLNKLREIRRTVGDDREFRETCDVYSNFSTGRNVLHHAADMGHFEICKFLIQNVNVYIDASTYKRDSPLIAAARREQIKIVDYLIKQGADVSMANLKGFTALHYAVLNDNRELMELLVIKGALLDADSVYGTPLQIAISSGNLEAAKFLLSHGSEPNSHYLVLESPLVSAITAHSFECLDLLLKAKADPNRYFTGFSPLTYAAKQGETRFLKSLLEAEADPNSHMIGHVPVIEDAALAHNLEGVEILFPLTKQIQHYPEWTVDGIMEYCHSEQCKREREEDKILTLAALDKAGHLAMDAQDYYRAIVHFKIAYSLDPCNAEWVSKQSLCYAHADRRVLALYNAEECFRLVPHLPLPHYGNTDAAAQIFKKFFMAGIAFTLDPQDNKTNDAFRVAFFDYFAWLYLMSSPEEIVNLTKD